MTNVTSENDAKKIYQLEQEKALVARQLNLAKGRQALTIKKLKNQGFEVLPVQATLEDPPIPDDVPSSLPDSEPNGWGSLMRGIGLAALSALITQLVYDYTYPRLRRLIVPDPPPRVEEMRQDMWGNQSIFK
jgi:hypothetical protein